MMLRRSTMFSLMLALCGGVALFLVKHEVQERESRLDALHAEISAHQDAIQVLKAEWSYLNRPERLQRLVHGLEEERPAARLQSVALERLPRLPETTQTSQIADAALPLAGDMILPMVRPVMIRQIAARGRP